MARTDNTRTSKGRYNVTHGDYGLMTSQASPGATNRLTKLGATQRMTTATK